MAHQIEKWANENGTNTKLAQAIFLPGAWGKIPVFMGKNHPTPRAAMAFSHAQNNPPFCTSKKFFKNVSVFMLTTPFILYCCLIR